MDSILQRIARGENAACAACLDAYGDLVWRLARRYLAFSGGETEDAVQDVFVEIWLSAGRFDPAKGSEIAFVATIAHRRLTDAQRKTSARRRAMQRVEPGSNSAPESGLRSVSDNETSRRAAAAFDELPQPERDALWLHVHRGMTHRQIVEATGSPMGTVKSRLRRGLMRLADAVRDESASLSGGMA